MNQQFLDLAKTVQALEWIVSQLPEGPTRTAATFQLVEARDRLRLVANLAEHMAQPKPRTIPVLPPTGFRRPPKGTVVKFPNIPYQVKTRPENLTGLALRLYKKANPDWAPPGSA